MTEAISGRGMTTQLWPHGRWPAIICCYTDHVSTSILGAIAYRRLERAHLDDKYREVPDRVVIWLSFIWFTGPPNYIPITMWTPVIQHRAARVSHAAYLLYLFHAYFIQMLIQFGSHFGDSSPMLSFRNAFLCTSVCRTDRNYLSCWRVFRALEFCHSLWYGISRRTKQFSCFFFNSSKLCKIITNI